jgi:hypothetical protein
MHYTHTCRTYHGFVGGQERKVKVLTIVYVEILGCFSLGQGAALDLREP